MLLRKCSPADKSVHTKDPSLPVQLKAIQALISAKGRQITTTQSWTMMRMHLAGASGTCTEFGSRHIEKNEVRGGPCHCLSGWFTELAGPRCTLQKQLLVRRRRKNNSKKCKSQSREDDRVQTQVPGSTGAAWPFSLTMHLSCAQARSHLNAFAVNATQGRPKAHHVSLVPCVKTL